MIIYRAGGYSLAILGWILSARIAVAQVSCGQTITGSAAMDSDLNCIGHSFGVKIDGGSLDMAGHRIIGCDPGGAAIILINTGGSVHDGVVMSCTDGVRLAGMGGHTIKNVVAKNNSDNGFEATSSNNKLLGSSALNNGSDGFHLATPVSPLKTKVQGCIASNNGAAGFNVDGDQNTLSGNTATGNTGIGMFISGDLNKIKQNNLAGNNSSGLYADGGTNGSVIDHNFAGANDGWGIAVFAGKSKIKSNVCIKNTGEGILSNAPDLQFSRNLVVGNGSFGMSPLGQDVRVTSNTVAANGDHGFFFGNGYTGSVVSRNRVLGNAGIGLYFNNNQSTISRNTSLGNIGADADDQTINCSTNTWSSNLLGTKADACIE